MSIYYKAAFCVYTANTFTTLVRAQRRKNSWPSCSLDKVAEYLHLIELLHICRLDNISKDRSQHLISWIFTPISRVDIIITRLLADFLGFGGALGIQVVVAALQTDQTGQLEGGDSSSNCTTDAQSQNINVSSRQRAISGLEWKKK